MMFDREVYSQAFFSRMKSKRIACVTYHKYSGDDCSEEGFSLYRVEMPNEEKVRCS
jgi:hypothetical protein